MRNRGSELLEAKIVEQGLSKLKTERLLGVHQGTVGRLLSGERGPGRSLAAVLAAPPWGIPLTAWDEPAAAPSPPSPEAA